MATRKLDIDFDPANSPICERIFDTMVEISRHSCRKVYVSRRPSSVHPAGSASLGAFDRGVVVDAGGEVYDNPALFVAGSVALSAPVGAPATPSIATWAENDARRFVG